MHIQWAPESLFYLFIILSYLKFLSIDQMSTLSYETEIRLRSILFPHCLLILQTVQNDL